MDPRIIAAAKENGKTVEEYVCIVLNHWEKVEIHLAKQGLKESQIVCIRLECELYLAGLAYDRSLDLDV